MRKEYIIIDDAVIDERVPKEIIYPLWQTVDFYSTKAVYEKSLEPYSFSQKIVYAMLWFMKEVNNGGLLQFYTNSTGLVYEDAMDGFEFLRITTVHDIIKESIKRFKGEPSYDKTEREIQLHSVNEQFDDLDKQYYKFIKHTSLKELIADYIQNNREDFYYIGEVKHD